MTFFVASVELHRVGFRSKQHGYPYSVWGLGFRVWCSMFGVQGAGLRDEDLGFNSQELLKVGRGSLGFSVSGLVVELKG